MILIIGLPNAGKTTYSKNFSNVCHADEFGMADDRYDKIAEIISDDLVIEGLFLKRSNRLKLLELAGDCQKTLIWLNTPIEECIRRKGKSKRTVLLNNLNFEPPTYSEGWGEIITITDQNEVYVT